MGNLSSTPENAESMALNELPSRLDTPFEDFALQRMQKALLRKAIEPEVGSPLVPIAEKTRYLLREDGTNGVVFTMGPLANPGELVKTQFHKIAEAQYAALDLVSDYNRYMADPSNYLNPDTVTLGEMELEVRKYPRKYVHLEKKHEAQLLKAQENILNRRAELGVCLLAPSEFEIVEEAVHQEEDASHVYTDEEYQERCDFGYHQLLDVVTGELRKEARVELANSLLVENMGAAITQAVGRKRLEVVTAEIAGMNRPVRDYKVAFVIDARQLALNFLDIGSALNFDSIPVTLQEDPTFAVEVMYMSDGYVKGINPINRLKGAAEKAKTEGIGAAIDHLKKSKKILAHKFFSESDPKEVDSRIRTYFVEN